MAKHARKKQKIAAKPVNTLEQSEPLGSLASLTDDTSKDDEERRLESLLFGTEYKPRKDSSNLIILDDESEDGHVGEKELENLLDSDLFFIDDASKDRPGNDQDAQGDSSLENQDGSPQAAEVEEESDEDSSSEAGEDDAARVASTTVQPSTKKGQAWADPDDPTLQVSLATDKRRRKLRDALAEDIVAGRDYERRLRRQFEKINPTPNWAADARKKLHPARAKRRRASASSSSDSSDDNDALPDLLSDTRGILKGGKRPKELRPGKISIERLRDANLSAKAEGEVKVVQFHPSPQIPVLLVASTDRRLRLFNIDGHTNPHLQTVHIPDLPSANAMFHPGGKSILLTGPRPYYYTYDLETNTAQRSPRGLWGTTFSNPNVAAQDASMEICAFDPSGEVLAVAGRRGHVHLVDWKGQGQVVGSVKMNVGVKSLWWAGGDRGELMGLGENSEVYVWDVGQRRCIRRWKDDGGFGSHIMSGDRAGRHLAVGSRTGLVNVYGPEASLGSQTGRPKLLKTIGNLTTSITSLRFNHDSQLLAMASNTKKDQMRLIHVPSLTAFSNWPTSSTPLGHVSSIDFSRGSEHIAIGNSRGRVLLYHLKDFSE
ncbi:uncharacterized protein FIBRA_00946 [Fibroporia radiculosa]|uniref:Uncharacterized protein n=1 Tax=Fibroporia radiculosa TaxID=599839 RepID=J4H0U1_9APHY|nr:uncharacterized protein FIBRA_00946 [Fibroporia radiculosa]CCL98939.1 predicted protein [Fibroporia radiculosa]